MPRKLRCNEIDLSQTCVYHVVSRCVRSIVLLHAEDDSRKELCMRCLELLSDATAVEVAGFSLMDNHLHLLLRVDVERAQDWTSKEVALQWLKLHPVRNGYFQPMEPTAYQVGELVEQEGWVESTRQKLCSISQFMKELKQRVAQAANRQDQVTGAFWEGRYKITAVHDEPQLLATMAYIDLNPFAANVCKTPESGRYTSLQGRVDRDKPLPVQAKRPAYETRGKRPVSKKCFGKHQLPQAGNVSIQPHRPHDPVTGVRQPSSAWLVPMDREYVGRRGDKMNAVKPKGKPKQAGPRQPLLPGLTVRRYLRLVDHVARLMRGGKTRLAKDVKPILHRLSLTPDAMRDAVVALGHRWQPYLAEVAAAA